MAASLHTTTPEERETLLETLVIQPELGQDTAVHARVNTLHSADIALLLDTLEEPDVRQKIFSFLPPDQASEVLSLVSPLAREELIQDLPDTVLGDLVERLDSDDAADLL